MEQKNVKDIVIGCIDGYEYNQIEPWIVSLERSGFDGIKSLVVYNGSADLIRKLKAKDILIFAFGENTDGSVSKKIDANSNLMMERFFHMWYFLSTNFKPEDIRTVITTDVKDVIFQKNPSKIAFGRTSALIAGIEGFTYAVEPWSRTNMKASFGEMIYEGMKDNYVICAGVLIAPFFIMLDLMLHIHLIGRSCPMHPIGGGGPDQAILNILLSSHAWNGITMLDQTSILHAGTSIPGIKAGNGDIGAHYRQTPEILDYYKENMHEGMIEPFLNEDLGGITFTFGSAGENFSELYDIIHQYDRIPEWKEYLNKKYRD